MVDAIHAGQAQGDVLDWRRNEHRRFERQLCRRRVLQARILRRAGYLLQRYVPLCRCGLARRARAWKRKALSPAPRGASSGSTRCSNRSRDAGPTGRSSRMLPTSLGADWNYQHPSEVMDEIASLTPMFAGVNYERLEGYKSLQWPVAADGTDEPLLYTKELCLPGRKGQAVSDCLDWPDRSAGCRVRPASEQWPAAGTFSRRQPDLSHRGNSRKDARHLCRSLAGAGRRARNSKRNLGATGLALRPGSRTRPGDRQGARAWNCTCR